MNPVTTLTVNNGWVKSLSSIIGSGAQLDHHEHGEENGSCGEERRYRRGEEPEFLTEGQGQHQREQAPEEEDSTGEIEALRRAGTVLGTKRRAVSVPMIPMGRLTKKIHAREVLEEDPAHRRSGDDPHRDHGADDTEGLALFVTGNASVRDPGAEGEDHGGAHRLYHSEADQPADGGSESAKHRSDGEHDVAKA